MEGPSTAAPRPQTEEKELLQLREVLGEALAQRGRYYKNYISFNFRFEADNTAAHRDAEFFKDMMKLLHMPAPRELVVKEDDRYPAWTVITFLHRLINHVSTLGECRNLIIGHYAGHATIDENNRLAFFGSDTRPKPVYYDRLFTALQDDESPSTTDVVLILDSCYSGAATRGIEKNARSVEVVASVGMDQKAFGNRPDPARTQNRTFTSRLFKEVAIRVSRGEASISLAQVVEALRRESNPDRRPEYRLQLGRVGIRIPVLSQAKLPPHLKALEPSTSKSGRRQESSAESYATASSTPMQSYPEFTAVFTVHLQSTDPVSIETRRLVDWVHSLHPSVGLELTGLYKADSTVFLFHAPWYVWAQLNGLQGVSLVCEAHGWNRLPQVVSQLQSQQRQSQQQSQQQRPPQQQMPLGRVENLPPRTRQSAPPGSDDPRPSSSGPQQSK